MAGAPLWEPYNVIKELTWEVGEFYRRKAMKAVPAIYQEGQITLSEPAPEIEPGPVKVLVVFPEEADDPWRKILDERTPRPSFLQHVEEVEKEIAAGKTEPLDLNRL